MRSCNVIDSELPPNL